MNIIKRFLEKSHSVERSLQTVMEFKARYLLSLAQVTIDRSLEIDKIDRSLLDQLYIESSEVEEFMDSADALLNRYWYSFRRSVAVIKIFSQVCYKLLHIHDSLPRYLLLPVDGNFEKDTEETIKMVRELLIAGSANFLAEAEKRHIQVSMDNTPDSIDDDLPFVYKLPSTRRVRHEDKPGAIVVSLATDFLNLSEPNDIFECGYHDNSKNLLATSVPDPISAESIRTLETCFHNMQSRYDTFVSGSDLPQQDKNLPVMRGHISVIYHLLKSAADCVHYYQRHVATMQQRQLIFNTLTSNDEKSISQLVSYFLLYADRYRKASRNLCREMIKQYAEMSSIDVPTPNYRGFHVRPSTLVSKIVLHYGSEVTMKLYDQEYNTAMPLDLFRANEELNARKRRSLYELIADCETIKDLPGLQPTFDQLKQVSRDAFLELAEKKLIIIYDPIFNFSDMQEEEGEGYLSFLKRTITRYMALGRIDAKLDVNVTFSGDKRVLEDLKILADNGYGEDRFGNNIVLPQELSYLQR